MQQPSMKVMEELYVRAALGWTSVLEHLFSTGKALGSIPSTVKRGHKGQGREERRGQMPKLMT